MDEGLPIAYQVLEKGVAVVASDGAQVGTVHHVVAAREQDIFHGLVIELPPQGLRFVEADQVASLHERGVDLRIDSTAVQSLQPPGGAAAVYDENPAEMKSWHHWVHIATMRGDWRRRS
jgi:hypothetical protein